MIGLRHLCLVGGEFSFELSHVGSVGTIASLHYLHCHIHFYCLLDGSKEILLDHPGIRVVPRLVPGPQDLETNRHDFGIHFGSFTCSGLNLEPSRLTTAAWGRVGVSGAPRKPATVWPC